MNRYPHFGPSSSYFLASAAKSGSGQNFGQIWLNLSTEAVGLRVDYLQLKVMKPVLVCHHLSDLMVWHTCSEISCNVKWNVYLAMEIPDCVSFISGQNSDDRVRSCEPNVFLA